MRYCVNLTTKKLTRFYSESFALQGIGNAIMNRLEKAAGSSANFRRVCCKTAEIQENYICRYDRYLPGTNGCGNAAKRRSASGICDRFQGMVVLFPEPVNQKAEAVMKSAQMTMVSSYRRCIV